MDRASVYGTEGCRFESLRCAQFSLVVSTKVSLFWNPVSIGRTFWGSRYGIDRNYSEKREKREKVCVNPMHVIFVEPRQKHEGSVIHLRDDRQLISPEPMDAIQARVNNGLKG